MECQWCSIRYLFRQDEKRRFQSGEEGDGVEVIYDVRLFLHRIGILATHLFVLGLLFSSVASGQEIGVVTSKSWTNNKELDHPFGIGVYADQPLFHRFNIRVDFAYHRNQRQYVGRTYDYDWLFRMNETVELVKGYSFMKSGQVMLGYSILRLSKANIITGLGVSLNTLDSVLNGTETGRAVIVNEARKFGYHWMLNVKMGLFSRFPIVFDVVFEHSRLAGPSTLCVDCVGLNSFDNDISTSVLKVGISYVQKE